MIINMFGLKNGHIANVQIRGMEHFSKFEDAIRQIAILIPPKNAKFHMTVLDEFGNRVFADFYTNKTTLTLSMRIQKAESKDGTIFIIRQF